MAPYQVIIAYDGTAFCGFQRQKNCRSIQSNLEIALKKLGWVEKAILFAGRTDAGVHAERQVIAFDLDWKHSDGDLMNALNDHLPNDVAVRTVSKTTQGFHPRYDAKQRIYRYQLYVSPTRDPLLERFNWRVWPALDWDLLIQATNGFIGTYDFRKLGCEIMSERKNIERTVDSAEWFVKNDNCLFFRICSQSFLYHMVRRIVFLLVRIGQRKIEPIQLDKDFRTEDLPAGIAPAKGLILEQVIY